jgi:putative oxidoreductase
MQRYIPFVFNWLLALPMIVFGLNKFFMFANVAPPQDPTAQAFLGAMFTSYLGKLVGFFEVVGGGLLLFRRTSFLGFLLLTPVIFNIVCFHFAHDFIGNGLWIIPTLLFLTVAYFQKSSIQSLFKLTQS